MFRKGKRNQSAINTLVGSDTQINGDVEFSGGCLVDGRVKGNVRANGEHGGMLSVSERGSVEGSVKAPHILLNGTVRGDVHATEKIELGPKSRVIGNVHYKLIEMAVGAEVNGKLIHDNETNVRSADSTSQSVIAPVKLVGE